jgi:hypothetical protein
MAEFVDRWRVEAALRLGAFWKWWSAELIALVPEPVMRRVSGWRRRLVLVIDGDRTRLSAARTLPPGCGLTAPQR